MTASNYDDQARSVRSTPVLAAKRLVRVDIFLRRHAILKTVGVTLTVILFAVTYSLLILMFIERTGSGIHPLPVALLFLSPIPAILFWFFVRHFRPMRQMLERCRDIPPDQIDDYIKSAVTRQGRWQQIAGNRIGCELFSCGYRGLAVLAQEPTHRALTPICEIRTEPIPLDEAHPAFGAWLTDNYGTSDEQPCLESTRENAAFPGSIKRALTFLRGYPSIFLLAIFWLFIGLLSLSNRDYWFATYCALLCMASLYGGPRWSGAYGANEQWFLVSGGLIFRHAAGIFAKSWSVRVINPANSIMVIYQVTKGTYYFQIVNDEGVGGSTCTTNEAIAILRAWSSELEPPLVEQLSDLT